MSCCSSDEGNSSSTTMAEKKYRGVRCRKWGKWVSEIRVPGTHNRLWLGSYATPEAAATAYDIASYCLRGPSMLHKLNFELVLPSSVRPDMSPTSIQRAASDAGMAVDARLAVNRSTGGELKRKEMRGNVVESVSCGRNQNEEEALSISVDDYLY